MPQRCLLRMSLKSAMVGEGAKGVGEGGAFDINGWQRLTYNKLG